MNVREKKWFPLARSFALYFIWFSCQESWERQRVITNVQQPTYQMSDSLIGIPTWKNHGVTDCRKQLLPSVISLINHFVSSLRIVLGVSPLIMFISRKYSIYWAHVSVDGQEDDFLFSCIVLAYRIYPGTSFITASICLTRAVDKQKLALFLFIQTTIKN